MGKRRWTAEENEYLQENWGIKSIHSLSKNLKRSPNAIIVKARKLKLGAFLQHGEYITYNELIKALGISCSSGYRNISWIKNREFPVHKKRVKKSTFKVVYIDEFWEWAEKNQSFIDFSSFPENALGGEPEWVKSKRAFDCHKKRNYKRTPWTKAEDDRLKRMLKEFRYTYYDLSRSLQRTDGAIQRRILDLKLKERPLKADNHNKWTDTEYNLLMNLLKSGATYEYMSEKLKKSSKAIRGTVYRMYKTENIDKIRPQL